MMTWTDPMGIRVVEDESLAPDQFRIFPPGRFVQTLAAGQEPMEFAMARVEQHPAPGYVQYFAFAKLNGTVRFVPAK